MSYLYQSGHEVWKDYNVMFRFTFKIGAAFEWFGVRLQLVMTRITDFLDSKIRLSLRLSLITSFDDLH